MLSRSACSIMTTIQLYMCVQIYASICWEMSDIMSVSSPCCSLPMAPCWHTWSLLVTRCLWHLTTSWAKKQHPPEMWSLCHCPHLATILAAKPLVSVVHLSAVHHGGCVAGLVHLGSRTFLCQRTRDIVPRRGGCYFRSIPAL